MKINHVALVCRSEKRSDRFYTGVLGLKKDRTKVIPKDLSAALFDIERKFKLITYHDGPAVFEIFIDDETDFEHPRNPCHTCIEILNMDRFLATCRENHVEVIQVPKNGGVIVFIKDFDSNMFEVKERPS